MLNRFPLNPVLPARDGARARAFYRDVLGLDLVSGPDDDPIMFLAGGGTAIVITELPDRIPPPYPVVSFLVAEIEGLVEQLRSRGVGFESLPDASSFAGQVGTRAGDVIDFGPVKTAWLKDSEGNLLALNQISV